MTRPGQRHCKSCTNSGYDSPDFYCDGGIGCENDNETRLTKIIKKAYDMKNDDDFGFSLMDETSVKQKSQDKMQTMLDLIFPLLDRLEKDADKAYIHWPNRVKKIAEFRKKLLDCLDS
jgi:hypothetical protein